MRAIKNNQIAILAILVVTAIVRFSTVIILNIEPISDYATYMKMATSMLDTGRMDDGMGNVAFYSSGYPLFLIPFFALFGSTPEVAQFVNASLGVVSVLLVYLCSSQMLENWKWAMIPALLWATYPPAILYTEYLAKENLMVPLLLLQTLILLHFPKSTHRIKLSGLLGVIFGAELLIGPAVILTGLLIGLVISNLMVKPVLKAVSLGPILASIIGCMLILTPWLNYTNDQLGIPVLNNNSGFNLYLGNNPNSEVNFVSIKDTPMGKKWHALRKEKGEVESFSILKEKAIVYILKNPGKTAWLSFNKITYFWFPPVHEGKYGNQSALEKLVRIIWLFYYVVIVSAALLAVIFFKKFKQHHLIMLATVILYCVIHAAAYVIFRYRLPIMPFLCILAVSGVNFICLWWCARKQSSNEISGSELEKTTNRKLRRFNRFLR